MYSLHPTMTLMRVLFVVPIQKKIEQKWEIDMFVAVAVAASIFERIIKFTLIGLVPKYGFETVPDEPLWCDPLMLWLPTILWLCDVEWFCACLFNCIDTWCICCCTSMCASKYEFFCSVVILSTFTLPSFDGARGRRRKTFKWIFIAKKLFLFLMNIYLKINCRCNGSHWFRIISQHCVTLHTYCFPFVELF